MLKKICEFLTGILILCLLVLACMLIVPRLLGYQSLAVLSGSMEPKIGVGAIVFAETVNPEEIKVGDVITYRISEDTLVTHRVIEVDLGNSAIYTQGDANDTRDASAVRFENIVGKVAFHIPLLGYLTIYAKTPLGIVAICTIIIVLIILTFLPEIFSDSSSITSSKKNTADED